MANSSIKITGNASVANVSCGFDCLGYVISSPSDTLIIEKHQKKGIQISLSGECKSIPIAPEKNTAGTAILSLLNSLEIDQGFKVHIEKGIPPGSGVGSSAASAVAAVVGVNELLGKPLNDIELLNHAMKGEAIASGSLHADNVAPVLFGGIMLVRSYNPLEVLKLPVPKTLFSTIILPEITINTKDARDILPKNVSLNSAVEQAGNLAGFILGLQNSDFSLLGRSMIDLFAEPFRSKLIPGYKDLKNVALDNGAIGSGISGSGPSVFALSDSINKAKNIGLNIVNSFKNNGINAIYYHSSIHTKPPKILD